MRLVYIALGWAIGIILANSTFAITPSTWIVLSAGMIVLSWVVWRNHRQRLTALIVLAFALGGLRMALYPRTSQVAAYNNLGGLTIEGIVMAAPDVRDDRIQLQVASETVFFSGETFTTSGTVLVIAPRTVDATYGDRISATGRLTTPGEYDTFSYADFLARSGVFSIMRNSSIEVISQGHGSPIYASLLDLRLRCAAIIARHLPEPQAGLLTGILLGDERGIAPELADAFSTAGASHVVAISGFNMVIVSGVVMGALERLRAPRRLAAVLGLTIIALYTIFVGANAAVVRAAIMASLLVIANVIQRKTYVPASLAFVALVMSAANPTILWDLSFQLSFFATLGLALFADPFKTRFDAWMLRLFPEPFAVTVGGFLTEPLVVTAAALITTLPLTLVYFSRASLVVFPVNLLIIPVQAMLFMLGMMAVGLGFVAPVMAQLVFWICLVLLSWTIGVVRVFAALPFAQVVYSVDPRLVFIFFSVIIVGGIMQATQPTWWQRIMTLVRRRIVVVTALLCGLAIFVLTLAGVLSRPDGQLHVWFLNQGHSNAVLMQTPGGAHILVDGGRFPSRLLTALGDRLPFYDQQIEVLFITQPDEFQYGALPSLLSRYQTGVVLTNGQTNFGDAFTDLETALAERQVLPVTAGYTVDFGDGVSVEVLHPQTIPEAGVPMTDHTLTLRVRYGEVSFLLTSQLNSQGQASLLDAGEWPLATVMQLPGQGTRFGLNERFLNAAQPSLVVLQSDPANQRGDPDGDVLNMLGETPLLRTDQGGTVHLWTDGRALWTVQER